MQCFLHLTYKRKISHSFVRCSDDPLYVRTRVQKAKVFREIYFSNGVKGEVLHPGTHVNDCRLDLSHVFKLRHESINTSVYMKLQIA